MAITYQGKGTTGNIYLEVRGLSVFVTPQDQVMDAYGHFFSWADFPQEWEEVLAEARRRRAEGPLAGPPIPLPPVGGVPPQGPSGGGQPTTLRAGGIGMVKISDLILKYGRHVIGPIITTLKAIGLVKGATVLWAQLPRWVQGVLVSLGITAGVTMLFDDDDDRPGVQVPFPGTDLTLPIPSLPLLPGVQPGEVVMIGEKAYKVVSGWQAGNIDFWRFSDGSLGVQKKTGVWKRWVPRRPIVIYSDGAASLRTALKADKALGKQSTKVASMLRRRGYEVGRPVKKKKGRK